MSMMEPSSIRTPEGTHGRKVRRSGSTRERLRGLPGVRSRGQEPRPGHTEGRIWRHLARPPTASSGFHMTLP